MKFGKLPATPKPTDFKFSALKEEQKVAFPPPPSQFGHGLIFKDWEMLGNDRVGDCVLAGFAHQEMLAQKLGTGQLMKFSERDVISDYSAVTGYVPGDESTDNGTYVSDALSYWRKTGILGPDGNRHQCGAYVSIDPKNWDELMEAAYVFSSVGIGFEVPSTIWDQLDAHQPWDVVDENAEIVGGHYVCVTGRNSKDTGGLITWGRRVGFTKSFYEKYNDETWAIVFPGELKKGKNERGFDMTQLNDLLAQLT